MRIATFAIASSIALALSSAAMAEETQVSATPVSDSQKISCHNMTHQGMLIGKPQCRTQYAWDKERRLALGAGVESVVLFALDQFCLVGIGLPLGKGGRRGVFMGS